MLKWNDAITDIPGIKVGQAHDPDALTGVTVILCDDNTTGGVDQRGGAPGTRETDLLRPMHLVNHVNAVMLAGGSAFGLDAAGGVVRYLEEKGIGYNSGNGRVPIVPAAILYDLGIGKANVRPDAAMGYQACLNVSSSPPLQGNAGAGMGASLGKILGIKQAMKSGIGTASLDLGAGILVGAIVAVNPFGDVIDPDTGAILAGARSLSAGPFKIGEPGAFADTLSVLKSLVGRAIINFASHQNTIIGVVATNAKLTKEETNRLAVMAHNGIARTIRPAHSLFDGDTLFSLATNKKKTDPFIVSSFVAEVVSAAILNAVKNARTAGGLPSLSEWI
ncbi:MAG TPA: P1 family peptidase [Anaerolineaceae bacterium]|nr:P1 family peptidase [Anaerolineaceae bacterium]